MPTVLNDHVELKRQARRIRRDLDRIEPTPENCAAIRRALTTAEKLIKACSRGIDGQSVRSDGACPDHEWSRGAAETGS